jgi:hypothetical protein
MRAGVRVADRAVNKVERPNAGVVKAARVARAKANAAKAAVATAAVNNAAL